MLEPGRRLRIGKDLHTLEKHLSLSLTENLLVVPIERPSSLGLCCWPGVPGGSASSVQSMLLPLLSTRWCCLLPVSCWSQDCGGVQGVSKALVSSEGRGVWSSLTSGFGIQKNVGCTFVAGEASCDKKCPLCGAKACEQRSKADCKET